MLVGATIGPFAIESEIGSGAMGTVYRARFRKSEDKTIEVALKVIALGLLGNDSAIARFDREANILKQLKHPNIVKLYATGKYRQTPFIAMEFINGEALDTILARRGRFSWEEVVAYGKQLCSALQHAHEHGIIHRDLKPSNLMLTKDGILKLTDFGIAKDTDVTALTGANSTIGTASYMSPEQCKGDRNLTNKSDLYSLGIVFFELLTGRKPFTADSTVDMFLKHVNETPPRPGKIATEVPGKLDALIMQLVEKDKDDRPVDAAWVMRLLQEIEEDAFARQSVGLDVATGKRGSRKAAMEKGVDDADRDAARALTGKKKKRKKDRALEPTPEPQRKGLKALAIVAALAGIGVGMYFAFKPPSQESLYHAVKNATEDEATLTAADRYLSSYGETPGTMTDFVQDRAREIRVKKRDEVLARRFEKGLSKPDDKDDPQAYQMAWLALEAEKAGNLKQATDLWDGLASKFAREGALREPLEDEVRARALWSWVAAKRTRDIQYSVTRVDQMKQQLQEEWVRESYKTYGPADPQGPAARALRLERLGDKPKARAVWDALATQTASQSDQHEWFLLASQRRQLMPVVKEDQALTERAALVAKLLEEARRAATQRDDRVQMRLARNNCRDIIDLYDGEVDDRIRHLVGEAKKFFDSLPKAS